MDILVSIVATLGLLVVGTLAAVAVVVVVVLLMMEAMAGLALITAKVITARARAEAMTLARAIPPAGTPEREKWARRQNNARHKAERALGPLDDK